MDSEAEDTMKRKFCENSKTARAMDFFSSLEDIVPNRPGIPKFLNIK